LAFWLHWEVQVVSGSEVIYGKDYRFLRAGKISQKGEMGPASGPGQGDRVLRADPEDGLVVPEEVDLGPGDSRPWAFAVFGWAVSRGSGVPTGREFVDATFPALKRRAIVWRSFGTFDWLRQRDAPHLLRSLKTQLPSCARLGRRGRLPLYKHWQPADEGVLPLRSGQFCRYTFFVCGFRYVLQLQVIRW
jgi:hypothetical protein